MRLTINLSEDEIKILKKRAEKNFLSLREMVENIIRLSCVRSRKIPAKTEKLDDKLVGIFSREKRRKR